MAEDSLRICTVSEGLDSVLRLAALVVNLHEVAHRVDLQLNEALEVLGSDSDGAFDLIFVAPIGEVVGDGRSHDMARAVLARAAEICDAVYLLLPPGAEAPPNLPGAVRLLHGPPFPTGGRAALDAAAQTVPGRAAPGGGPQPPDQARWPRPPAFLQRLLHRVDPPAAPIPVHPAPPPEQLSTLVVQGTCGGAGATTLALNLAAELATRQQVADRTASVCLLDLNLQFGAVAEYLGLPPNSRVTDAYRGLVRLDADAFRACLQSAGGGLQVFAAPAEVLPMDALDPVRFNRLLSLARTVAPLIVIDMPPVVLDWSECAYTEADRILCVSLLDLRAARNARYLSGIFDGIGVPLGRVGHVLNRAPVRRGRDWLLRRESFERGLKRQFAAVLSDGGAEVAQAVEAGLPLGRHCVSNLLTREVQAMAGELGRGLARRGADPKGGKHADL